MRAFAKADREVRLGFRRELRNVARPVQQDAEQLATTRIRSMPRSPQWARMRVGITRREVYVVPRQKGVRGQGPKARPKFATEMYYRAMQPALQRNRGEIVRRFEEALNRMAAD